MDKKHKSAPCASFTLQGSVDPTADQPALVLVQHGEDAYADSPGIDIRHIGTNKIHPAILEGKDKGSITAESIKFGNHQSSFNLSSLP